MLDSGTGFRSPGGSFSYVVAGPCCRLFDRETLPWPCCRLSWRGKEPSWRRQGRRLVGDLAARSFPSYAVVGCDRDGNTWESVVTDYTYKLRPDMKRWWYSQFPPAGKPWPSYPGTNGADGPSAEAAENH